MIAPAAAALLAALLVGAGPREVGNACLSCHALPALAGRIRIDPEIFRRSVHAATACRACHAEVSAYPHGPVRGVDCAACHEEPRRWAGRFHDHDFLGVALLPSREDGVPFVAAVPGAAAYLESAHGRSAARGSHEVPTCSDCHGEHAILPHADPRSPTSRRHAAQDLCLGCHDRAAIQEKFGLPARRGATYLDSYHGLAARGRGEEAAVCVDCHDAHRILGADDDSSTIHPSRLVGTCGRCHAGATAAWVSILTFPAIRRRWAAAAPAAGGPARFRRAERAQHAVLVVSFVTLVVTGFALAFPDAFWVAPLAAAGLDEELRGLVHCPDPSCAMSPSTSAEEVDLKGPDLCGRCRDRAAAPRPVRRAVER